jgi:hypothetical protein
LIILSFIQVEGLWFVFFAQYFITSGKLLLKVISKISFLSSFFKLFDILNLLIGMMPLFFGFIQ